MECCTVLTCDIVTGVDLSDFDIRYRLVALVGQGSSSSHGRKIALLEPRFDCQRSYGRFSKKETRSTKFHGKFPGEDSKLLQNQEFLENWLQFLGVVSNGLFCKNLMIPFPNLMNHQIVRPFLAILLPIPDWWSLLGLSSHCDGDLVLWCFVKLRTQKTRLNKQML